jgi:hypothetical protein
MAKIELEFSTKSFAANLRELADKLDAQTDNTVTTSKTGEPLTLVRDGKTMNVFFAIEQLQRDVKRLADAVSGAKCISGRQMRCSLLNSCKAAEERLNEWKLY